MQVNKFISLKDSYKMCVEVAGDEANSYKKTLLLHTLNYFFQGLAFAFFYPLIQAVINKNYENSLFWFIVITILTVVSVLAKWFAHDFDYTQKAPNINHALRLKLGKKLRSMPLEKLYTYRTGELNSMLSSGVDESVLMMGFISGMVLEVLIIPLMIVLSAFMLDFKLGLALLIAFPFSIPLYKRFRNGGIKERVETRAANEALESNAIEYIQGMSVLKSLNLVGENAKSLHESTREVEAIQIRGLKISQSVMTAVNSLIEIAILLSLLMGVYLITNSNFSAAALITLIVWITRIIEPLSNFLAITGIMDIANIAFKGITNILNIKDLEVSDEKIPKNFDIVFENVDFAYLNTNDLSLRNLNFEIPANSLTAIVGDSGSGKTTITKLIMRYSDVLKGSVKIGGIDVKHINTKDLMENISVVFQDVYLFDDTILNNIRMANPNASDEKVLNAARAAHCHDFIERLPNGYDTVVGEIGGSLSGGEKQRISIARAILKNSPIVILDEPTSALDTESEVAVQQALNALVKDKTVIIIAHRLSTITGANKILVVENGSIKESGTHKELIDLNGKYKKMFEAQARVKEWHIK